eukprot:5278496-Pyramimonas_sp.AAC.1
MGEHGRRRRREGEGKPRLCLESSQLWAKCECMGASIPGFPPETRQPFAILHAGAEHGQGQPHVAKNASLWEKPHCHEPGSIRGVGKRRGRGSPGCA